MKILYIFKEYKDRRARYADIIRSFGHNVDIIEINNKKEAGQITEKDIKKHNPDMLFLLSPFYIALGVITKDAIAYCKNKNILIICYSTLNTQVPYYEWIHVWKKFDVFFAQNIHLHKYLLSISVNSYYLPLGFHPDQYYLVSNSQNIKNIPVSFMGNPQTTVDPCFDRRALWLKYLINNNVDIKIYGKGFIERGIAGAISFNTHVAQALVYHRTKVNIDLPFINSSECFYEDIYHIKNRFFEIPACNEFLLTIRDDEFVNILNDDMVGYCGNYPEAMREEIDRYLKDDKLRVKMAKRAYREVIQKHTFMHRFQEIFKILES